ncbi:MAG: response regulator transcription factor [Deltaproteobacteria bacterium]|nr:response regulator transcription factor [Deltaproteobacteria bacterium]
MDAVRLVIVEDSRKYAEVLAKALAKAAGIEVAGVFGTAEELLASLSRTDADVALLDIGLPGMDGIELVSRLRAERPEMELLMLTAFEDEERLFRALKAGASGYLTKRAPMPSIVQAVKDISGGGTVISPALARRFCNHFASLGTPAETTDRFGLTEQEKELLGFLARGLTNAEAGSVMNLPRRTVRTILSHIYKKMGTNSRVEAVTLGLRAGVVSV